MLDYLLLLAGLAVLILGGDLLVRGSVGMAEKLHIPALIIGLTIVAFGTSAPELFISVQAALKGASGIAIGNVVGSNITNVLLVMGIPALLAPTICDEEGIGRNILVMIGFTLVYMAMLLDGNLDRFEGFVLLALLGLYLYGQVRVARRKKIRASADLADYHDEIKSVPTKWPVIIGLILGGLVALPVGAELTVTYATVIARYWGVSDAVIGLTIVALGTSLPELATSIMAILRGNVSLAIGNVVGSNIFNIGSIMGIATLIKPMTVEGHILTYDIWIMLACAVLIAALAHWQVKIGKRVGSVMTALYVIYIAVVFAG